MFMEKPLQGLRVVDLTIFLSGPFCTQLLAGLGAEVIKVERPISGDPARFNPPYVDSRGVHFESPRPDSLSLSILKRNRNKRSVTLNLKTERGKDIFRELVRKSDIVTENFSPGTMKRLGLDFEALRAINPGLIYCCISGFGQYGPYRDRTAFDVIVQATSGVMASTGFSDGPPLRTGMSVGDLVASLYAAVGVLSALRFRNFTGKGQMIDVSMMDGLFSFLLDEAKDFYSSLGMPDRSGNHRRRMTPFGVYETSDGHVAICIGSDKDCHELFRCMGRDDLIADPRFCTLEARWKNADAVNAAVEQWTKCRAKAEVVAELAQHQLPCGPVQSISEVRADPQLAARDMIVPIEHVLFGKVDNVVAAGFPIKMSESPGDFDLPAPLLGQHNEEVYTEILGMTSEEIRLLAKEGVI
jgi:crotonobetainyl-CoA:carnitine CoA-transferase CaiB-like acyl-CoA transferase